MRRRPRPAVAIPGLSWAVQTLAVLRPLQDRTINFRGHPVIFLLSTDRLMTPTNCTGVSHVTHGCSPSATFETETSRIKAITILLQRNTMEITSCVACAAVMRMALEGARAGMTAGKRLSCLALMLAVARTLWQALAVKCGGMALLVCASYLMRGV